MNGLIDIHSHLYTPLYLDLLRSRERYPRVATVDGEDRFIIFPEEDQPGRVTGRPIGESFWSIDAKLDFMSEVGIDRTVVSLGNPWLDPFNGPDSGDHAALLNEDLAELPARTDDRVSALGVLPSHDAEAAAAVVRQIAEQQRLVGIITGPTICRKPLDDPQLDVVWEALNATGLPWMLHPSDGVGIDVLEGYGHSLPVGLGFPFETTVAITRLVFGGVLQRFPDVKLIASHAGGTLPFLAGRLDAAWRSDSAAQKRLTVEPSSFLAKLHLDAIAYHSRTLTAAVDLADGKLAFGTDHPFSVADPSSNLSAIDEIGDAGSAIRSAHAERLFGL